MQVVEEGGPANTQQRLLVCQTIKKAWTRGDREVVTQHGPLYIGLDEQHSPIWKVPGDGDREPETDGRFAFARYGAAHGQYLGCEPGAGPRIDAAKQLVTVGKWPFCWRVCASGDP